MSELITTLHPHDDNSVDIYPNIKLENIIDGKSEDAGKFVKVDEDGKFVVETVNIPEPPQVNNSTITIKQGGVDKGSFTLNQAENTTIELDASGGTSESGSSIYATTSAISKGTPAHTEAVNPIRVGDTISQLYFNTNQDIKFYLENCVNWSDRNKVQDIGGYLCIYILLSALSDENSLDFRSLKVGDYIKCLKIKSDFEPGDSKVDSELNSWLANILSSNSSVTLLNVANITSGYEALRAYTSDNSTYELQLKSSQSSDWSTIYSSTSGYSYNGYNSEEHAYNVTDSSKEVQIETINESTGWNGVFFGAISDIGEPLLTAFLYPGNPESYIMENTYFLGKSMFAIDESGADAIYYSSGLLPMETPLKAGWHVEAGQSITLDSPEKAKVVSDAVSKIAANDNNWADVDEVLGSIYQDKILGTDEVKVNDILIDTEGLFGKVKELSEESIKNQHPENPFTVGEKVNSDSVLYFDTSIIPDLSKLDWGLATDNEGQLMLMVASPLPLTAVKLNPLVIYNNFGVKANNPIYLFVGGSSILYLQIDPSDMDTFAGTYLTEQFPIEAWNNWVVQGQFEHEGSVYKIPAGLEETSTLSAIISQDVWGAYVTKDGKWIEDTPTLKTKVSCESLRQLPTNYKNISGTPIITINSFLEGDFIKNYVNKYIQDCTGIIYFCDGENVHKLTGDSGFNGNSINLNPSYGLKCYVYSSSDNNYSNEFGLTDNQLYSQSDGDQVFGKRSGDYGWIDLPSQADNEAAILKKYTKPDSGIPASDLSSEVQDSIAKANSALQENALVGYMTTSTEQEITGNKKFNGGLSSSSTGSNGIQTTLNIGAGSDVVIEQQKSGIKLGIKFNTTENQLSIYSVSGETEHRLDFNGDGVKYGESELATKADLNSKIANTSVVGSVDYDNTTLKDHIDEILGYVNSENGGTLVSIGFKVGTEGKTATATYLTTTLLPTPSIKEERLAATAKPVFMSTKEDIILLGGSYYYAYPEQVVTSGDNKGVFFTCRNGYNFSRGMLYISSVTRSGSTVKEAKLTGEGQSYGIETNDDTGEQETQMVTTMFQDVDVSEVTLEHLTLNFYKFNQAD